MAIFVMADNNVDITTQRDAVMYNLFANKTDLVFGGVGNQLNCSASGLVVTCQSGECLIQGRHVTVVDTETVQVGANSNGHVVLRYDLTRDLGDECYLTFVSSLVKGDLNNGASIRDIELYTYTSTGTTVTLTDNRNIVNDLQSALKTTVNGKAPTNHASSATTYGLGTTSLYGHVKTINNLTQASHQNGTALSAYQGKVLDGKMMKGVVKDLGNNYVMKASDFDEYGMYKISTFATSPSNNAPAENVGDFYALKVYNGSSNFATFLLFSPRLANSFYYGLFWKRSEDTEGIFQGWKKVLIDDGSADYIERTYVYTLSIPRDYEMTRNVTFSNVGYASQVTEGGNTYQVIGCLSRNVLNASQVYLENDYFTTASMYQLLHFSTSATAYTVKANRYSTERIAMIEHKFLYRKI